MWLHYSNRQWLLSQWQRRDTIKGWSEVTTPRVKKPEPETFNGPVAGFMFRCVVKASVSQREAAKTPVYLWQEDAQNELLKCRKQQKLHWTSTKQQQMGVRGEAHLVATFLCPSWQFSSSGRSVVYWDPRRACSKNFSLMELASWDLSHCCKKRIKLFLASYSEAWLVARRLPDCSGDVRRSQLKNSTQACPKSHQENPWTYFCFMGWAGSCSGTSSGVTIAGGSSLCQNARILFLKELMTGRQSAEARSGATCDVLPGCLTSSSLAKWPLQYVSGRRKL